MLPKLAAVLLLTSIFPAYSGYAGGFGHHRSERFRAWLQGLSELDRAKYEAARETALKNQAVIAARERKKKADQEYRSLLNREILKVDPSLKSLVDKVADLEKRDL